MGSLPVARGAEAWAQSAPEFHGLSLPPALGAVCGWPNLVCVNFVEKLVYDGYLT
jgi:hypothetical protein